MGEAVDKQNITYPQLPPLSTMMYSIGGRSDLLLEQDVQLVVVVGKDFVIFAHIIIRPVFLLEVA